MCNIILFRVRSSLFNVYVQCPQTTSDKSYRVRFVKPFGVCMILGISNRFNDLIYGSRVLSIPLIRCDNQIFNRVIEKEVIEDQVLNVIVKEEFNEKLDHKDNNKLLKTGIETGENLNTIDTKIKTEIDIIDGYEFKGTVFREKNSSEIIDYTYVAETSNLREKPLTDICDKILTASSLTKHSTISTGEKPYINIFFSDTRDNDEENDVHTNTNYDSLPYKCDICTKTFKYKSWLKRHKLSHEVGHIQCNYCPKLFKRCDSLKRHLISHLGGGKSYDCQHCGKQLSYKFSLKHHINSQHIENVKKVCCPICQKKLSNHKELRYHNNRVHSGMKPFICWCLIAFHAPNKLYQHRRKMGH
ncbi:hypothetical protein ACI65C_001418 [Semiaphis heraclei]